MLWLCLLFLCSSPSVSGLKMYLQNEDKVVDRFVSLKEVVLRRMFVLGVELELLHNAGVLDETQQDLLWQVTRPERLHLYKMDACRHPGTHRSQKHSRNRVNERTPCSLSHVFILHSSCHPLCAHTNTLRTSVVKHIDKLTGYWKILLEYIINYFAVLIDDSAVLNVNLIIFYLLKKIYIKSVTLYCHLYKLLN